MTGKQAMIINSLAIQYFLNQVLPDDKNKEIVAGWLERAFERGREVEQKNPTYTLEFKTLRKVNVERCEESFHAVNGWSQEMWALAVAGETGELCNQLKKIHRGDFTSNQALEKATQDAADEIADIVIYADLLAARMGFKLEDLIRRKFNAVSDRVKSTIKL